MSDDEVGADFALSFKDRGFKIGGGALFGPAAVFLSLMPSSLM
jgi:hypothetical protein